MQTLSPRLGTMLLYPYLQTLFLLNRNTIYTWRAADHVRELPEPFLGSTFTPDKTWSWWRRTQATC